jgi:hypothetical protein
MLEPSSQARLISVRDLPRIVEDAVKNANKRLGTVPDTAPAVNVKKWEIYGRVLRDLAQAGKFADAVTAEVAKSGIAVSPATLIIDKHIWCGFIERPNIPVDRNF